MTEPQPRSSSTGRQPLPFLGEAENRWLAEHGYFVETVYERFEADGHWPEQSALLRQIRAKGLATQPHQVLDSLPPDLGWRDTASERVHLTLFGLGVCPAARALMDAYFTVIDMAVDRFDDGDDTLSRAEVAEELDLSDNMASLLSLILMADAPFLAGGSSDPETWERSINPRVSDYENAETINEFLVLVARERRCGPFRPQPVAPVAPPSPPSGGGAQGAAGGPSGSSAPSQTDDGGRGGGESGRKNLEVIGLGLSILLSLSSLLGAVDLPSWLTGAVIAAAVAIAVLLAARLPSWLTRPWRWVLVVALIAIGAGLGAVAAPSPSGPYHYFVTSTEGRASLLANISPSHSAPVSRQVVYVEGDPVAVTCIVQSEGGSWAKLTDGTFLPAQNLTPEAPELLQAPGC